MLENLRTSFDRLFNEPFPSKGGKEVLGIDLVLIDSDTMGLISRYLDKKGILTPEEKIILNSCLEDLNKIVPHLNKEEEKYFASLKRLTKEIIETDNSDD